MPTACSGLNVLFTFAMYICIYTIGEVDHLFNEKKETAFKLSSAKCWLFISGLIVFIRLHDECDQFIAKYNTLSVQNPDSSLCFPGFKMPNSCLPLITAF